MKISGIYCIKNMVNGKCYIGQSVDINQRWRRHFHELRQGIHSNAHLQASYDKYGDDSFIFLVLERTSDLSKLTELEEKWVEALRSNDNKFGYNKRICADSCKGIKRSERTLASYLEKRSKAWASKTKQEIDRINAVKREKSKKMWAEASEEQREKMLANLRPPTKGFVSWNKGKKWPEAHRMKLVEAWKRRKARGDVPWNKGLSPCQTGA